ncbi:sulfotransferase family 2 domain-containing protein [Roseibium sp. SCP14]|uniref:sulfotransferase family 2 domain-containing protein n=1 Tax=Roseibium sp. SCP14 TaxID=3141375 RepID=UPI00333BBA2E
MNPNICHERGVVFVHNPKTAGMSFRKWLGFTGVVNHGVPTVNVPYQLWNKYTVIVVVRDPMERAISCYRFLTHESYAGGLKKAYPDLSQWDPLTFFRRITSEQLYILACQYKYTQHLQSNKGPDFLFKFEDMDTTRLAKHLDIETPFPRENIGKSRAFVELTEDLYYSLIDYFKVDYLLFNYKPKPYKEFLLRQEMLVG